MNKISPPNYNAQSMSETGIWTKEVTSQRVDAGVMIATGTVVLLGATLRFGWHSHLGQTGILLASVNLINGIRVLIRIAAAKRRKGMP